jgi:hypothetical protein
MHAVAQISHTNLPFSMHVDARDRFDFVHKPNVNIGQTFVVPSATSFRMPIPEAHSDLINRPRIAAEEPTTLPMTHTNTLFAPELGLPEPQARAHTAGGGHHTALWAAVSRSRNLPQSRQFGNALQTESVGMRSRRVPRGIGEGRVPRQMAETVFGSSRQAMQPAGPVGEGADDGSKLGMVGDPVANHNGHQVRWSPSAARYVEAASQDLHGHDSIMTGGISGFPAIDALTKQQRPSKGDLFLAQQVSMDCYLCSRCR